MYSFSLNLGYCVLPVIEQKVAGAGWGSVFLVMLIHGIPI